MTMTPAEIVANYRQAKQPMKQIAILADLNGVPKDEIVEILREADAELPGNYTKKKTTGTGKRPATASQVIGGPTLYESALVTISRLIKRDVTPEAFLEQVRGVLALVQKLEEDNDRNDE